MTAIAPNYCAPPPFGQWEEGLWNRPRVEAVAEPWTSTAISSGGFYSAPCGISPKTGVTRWLEDLLSAPDETLCPLTTPEVPAALAEIRDAFSLNTSQLSTVLQVTRQTIYNWVDGKPVDEANRRRIAAVRELALTWLRDHGKPMGPVASEQIDGASLISMLAAEALDERAIQRKFDAIAARIAAAEANRPSSARELAGKFGIEPLSEEQYQKNQFVAGLRYRRGR